MWLDAENLDLKHHRELHQAAVFRIEKNFGAQMVV